MAKQAVSDQQIPLRVRYSVDDVEDDTNVSKTETNVSPEDEIEIQVAEKHETDSDDPLEALKKQFEDVKAQKEEAERYAFEADRRARESAASLQQHQQSELGNHKAILEQAYNTEELKLKSAKQKYATSLRDGDYDSAAEFQDEIVRTNNLMARYAEAYDGIQQKEKAPPPQQTASAQGDPFDEALKTMHPKVAAWAIEHRDDVTDPDRQKLAFASDAMATALGYMPGSDPYMEYMDQQMGYSEPTQPKTKVSRRSVAAPASRASTSSNTRRVVLNDDDKRMARSLSLSDVQYAEYKLKAADVQTNYGGRLHASYSAGD